MKLNELMIDDWVSDKKNNRPYKITGTNDLLFHNDYSPISLTAEILEKNGFKQGFIPALKTESNLLLVANIGEDYIEVRFDRRNIAIWLDYDENGDGIYSDYLLPLPIYVHQLQHALRLCNIEKEIEL